MRKNENVLNEIYKKYNLDKDNDLFTSTQGWTIIKRNAIDKIQSEEKVDVKFELINYDPIADSAAVKAIGTFNNNTIETFGEATPKNCIQKYKLAMAEKRALSRVVLKLLGYYAEGVFGEDESDWKEEKKSN